MESMNTTAIYHSEETDLSGGIVDELYKSLKIMSITIYSLVFVLGVLGNGVVILVTGFKMKKTVNIVWYLNLAVADFLFTAFLSLTITETALDGHWPFGQFMCKLHFIILSISMYANIYILMVISVDRCVRVVCSVWVQNHRSVRNASCVSLGVWVLAVALSSPYFIVMETQSNKDKSCCVATNALADVPIFLIWLALKFRLEVMVYTKFLKGFMVPFTVIFSCYSVVIYRLKRALAIQTGRHFKIMAAVITAFFLCRAPFHIMEVLWVQLLLHPQREEDSVTSEYGMIIGVIMPIAVCLAVLRSCLNPLLYVFMGPDSLRKVSILKLLQNYFTEELPRTYSSTNLAIITRQETALPETQV